MSNPNAAHPHAAKGVSFKVLASRNSPWYGLAEFWSFETMESAGWNMKLVKALFFGTLSGLLYFLLFEYEGELRHFEQLTHDGEKIDFLIPIAIALLLSLVHGAFTGYFWDLLGVKPKHAAQARPAREE